MGLAERIRKRKFDEDDPMREQHVNRLRRRGRDPKKPEVFDDSFMTLNEDAIRANAKVAKPEDLQ